MLNRNHQHQDVEEGGQSSHRHMYVLYLDSTADVGIKQRAKAAGSEHI